MKKKLFVAVVLLFVGLPLLAARCDSCCDYWWGVMMDLIEDESWHNYIRTVLIPHIQEFC